MEYTYYAFISYKREDKKWAVWLQKKLESYGFPVKLRKQNNSLPATIRPIFRDQSDLSGGNLKAEIEKGLADSKYLIVICSPRAAKSPWVSKEVQYFIDNGRENNIIPFIIGGNPNANNPEEECFPEGLRQLSAEKEILAINIYEIGREAAAIKVIAYMFGIRFDTLWQRHERAQKKEADRLQRELSRIKRLQIRLISEKCKTLVMAGNAYLARKVLSEVFTKEKRFYQVLYVAEYENALRLAMKHEDALFLSHTAHITSFDICSCKCIIATGSADMSIKIWSINDGKLLTTLLQENGFKSWVECVCFNDEGTVLAASTYKTIRFWTIQNYNFIEKVEIAPKEKITSIIFINKKEIIFSSEFSIFRYSLGDPDSLQCIAHTESQIVNLFYDQNKNCFFVHTFNSLLSWHMDHHLEMNYICECDFTTQVDVDPVKSQIMITSDLETKLITYFVKNALNPECLILKTQNSFKSGKFAMFYGMDGLVVTENKDNSSIKVFDPETNRITSSREVKQLSEFIKCAKMDKTTGTLYLAAHDTLRAIDMKSDAPEYIRLSNFTEKIKSFILDQSHKKILTITTESKNKDVIPFSLNLNDEVVPHNVVILDYEGNFIQKLELKGIQPDYLAIDNIDRHFMVIEKQHWVVIFDMNDYKRIWNLACKDIYYACFGGHRDECIIVSRSEKEISVQVYDYKKSIQKISWKYELKEIYELNFTHPIVSKNGKYIAISDGRFIFICLLTTGQVVSSIHMDNYSQSMTFSCDSKEIAVATDNDYAVCIYKIDGTVLGRILGQFNLSAIHVSYSEDGKYIIVTGDNKVIVIETNDYSIVDEFYYNIENKAVIQAQLANQTDGKLFSLDGMGGISIRNFASFHVCVENNINRFKTRSLSVFEKRQNYLE